MSCHSACWVVVIFKSFIWAPFLQVHGTNSSCSSSWSRAMFCMSGNLILTWQTLTNAIFSTTFGLLSRIANIWICMDTGDYESLQKLLSLKGHGSSTKICIEHLQILLDPTMEFCKRTRESHGKWPVVGPTKQNVSNLSRFLLIKLVGLSAWVNSGLTAYNGKSYKQIIIEQRKYNLVTVSLPASYCFYSVWNFEHVCHVAQYANKCSPLCILPSNVCSWKYVLVL